MSVFRVEKVVSVLPDPLQPNCVYVVRTGSGFDLYVSDSTGSVAHALNQSGGNGTSNVFIQETEPAAASPFIWYKTDATGNVVDILKG